MNLIITDISTIQLDLDKLYEEGVQNVLTMVPRAKLVFKDKDFIYQGLAAMRARFDWTPQADEKQTLSLYQIQVADKNRENLYVLSFTTLKIDFEKARPIFDNIASTFRV